MAFIGNKRDVNQMSVQIWAVKTRLTQIHKVEKIVKISAVGDGVKNTETQRVSSSKTSSRCVYPSCRGTFRDHPIV